MFSLPGLPWQMATGEKSCCPSSEHFEMTCPVLSVDGVGH